MKNFHSTFLFFFVIGIALSGCQFTPAEKQTNANINTISSASISIGVPKGWSAQKRGDKIDYRIDDVGLSFALSSEFSYLFERIGDQGLIEFSRPNTRTSQEDHRDTPNGFNTAAEDRWMVEVFEGNNSLRSTSSFEDFKAWHDEVLPGLNIVSSEVQTFGTYDIRMDIEQDGILSEGRYAYVFRDGFIILFGSGDVEKAEFDDILRSME